MLLEEIAGARGFQPRQSVLQIYGTCEDCQAGRRASSRSASTEILFARDALKMAIATERSGLDFYTRGAKLVRDARARKVFKRLSEEETEHLDALEARYQELLAEDPCLESYPRFLFFKGAANGLFASGAEELAGVVDDREALMIGIKCERFEDSEGKRIFLEFADEEREHLELLIREYRALVARVENSSRRSTSRKAKVN